MTEKLRAHVEELFKDAPKTKQAVEIKEEILQNTIDRYNDLIAEGKSEEAAFNISVAGIGDVNALLANLMAPQSMSGYTKEEIAKNERRRAVLLAVSVMMYIICIIPPILFDEIGHNDTVGIVLMFVIAAIATGLIIYRSGTSLHYNKTDDTVVENFKEWNQKKKVNSSLFGAVSAAIWSLTLIVYFLVSFLTGAWWISWLIFLIGGTVSGVAKAILDLTE